MASLSEDQLSAIRQRHHFGSVLEIENCPTFASRTFFLTPQLYSLLNMFSEDLQGTLTKIENGRQDFTQTIISTARAFLVKMSAQHFQPRIRNLQPLKAPRDVLVKRRHQTKPQTNPCSCKSRPDPGESQLLATDTTEAMCVPLSSSSHHITL